MESNQDGSTKLLVTKFSTNKFTNDMENQIKNGYPVLIEEVDQ